MEPESDAMLPPVRLTQGNVASVALRGRVYWTVSGKRKTASESQGLCHLLPNFGRSARFLLSFIYTLKQ